MGILSIFSNRKQAIIEPVKSSEKCLKQTITTTLNGNSTKGRQDILNNLNTFHDPLKVHMDIKNGSLSLIVGKTFAKSAGTIDSKITRDLEKKFSNSTGLSCDLKVGTSYTIIQNNDGLLSCNIELQVFN